MNITNKRIIRAAQGTPEWHKHRATSFNASDAAAMLGISPYTTRSELLHEKATGATREIDAQTQKRFDDGHAFEAIARPWAEEIIGEELYPCVLAADVDGLPLSASYDGLTMLEDVAFEHKTLNEKLAAALDRGEIPEEYLPQMEQQALISGANKVLFMASNGDRETMRYAWYEPRAEVRKQLLAGWKQFAEDLQNYQPPEPVVEVVGRAPDALPALRIEVTGMVTASNLEQFREHALAVFDSINTDLQTDEDFANAEKTVKWCGEVEKRLDAAKEAALAQTQSIDELFRAIDSIKDTARQTRLKLDKLVKARKEAIRNEILQAGKEAYDAHLAKLNESVGANLLNAMSGTAPFPDFAGVMKGKKTVKSLRDAVDQELARVKIAANEIAERVRANLKTLEGLVTDDQRFLIQDWRELVFKDADAVEAIVKQRISEHEQAERERLERERERIRQEEAAKLQREQEERERAAREAQLAEKRQQEAVAEQPVAPPEPATTKRRPETLLEELTAWRQQNRVSDDAFETLLAILDRHHALEKAA